LNGNGNGNGRLALAALADDGRILDFFSTEWACKRWSFCVHGWKHPSTYGSALHGDEAPDPPAYSLPT
jgi:hypothetical protein